MKYIRILIAVAVVSAALSSTVARTAYAAVSISNVAVHSIDDTSVTITWESSVAGDSWVGYVAAGSTAQKFKESSLSTQSHSITLVGLSPGTQYTYEVNTQTILGEVGYIAGLQFTTTGQAPATGGPASGIPCGTLAKSGAAIYFLTGKDKVKIPFTSMAAFTGLGYGLNNVKTTDISAYKSSGSYYLSSPTQEHPWCSWMKWKDGTVYYSHPSGSIPVPSWDIFLNNGGRADLIVPMNAADDAIWAQNPNLPPLQLNDARIL